MSGCKGSGAGCSGMASYDDAHHFQIQNNKTKGLKDQVAPEEFGSPGRKRGIGFIIVSPDDIFSHVIQFVFEKGCYSGISHQKG